MTSGLPQDIEEGRQEAEELPGTDFERFKASQNWVVRAWVGPGGNGSIVDAEPGWMSRWEPPRVRLRWERGSGYAQRFRLALSLPSASIPVDKDLRSRRFAVQAGRTLPRTMPVPERLGLSRSMG